MAAASSASATSNDAENRIVGMMVGSAVADALGVYTDGLTKQEVSNAYRRRILASYKAHELTHHFPDTHRAKYERLRVLSREGNRALGLLPLDLGQPTKAIVESIGYLADGGAPARAALKRWVDSNHGRDDKNGSNAPLVRIHPLAAFGAQKTLSWSLARAVDNCRRTHVDSRCNISVLIAIALLRGLIRQDLQTEQQINPLIQRCKKGIDFWRSQQNEDRGNENQAYYLVPSAAELSRLLTTQSLKDLELDKSEDRGDVWKCLSAGVFCLRTAMVRLERLAGQPQVREDNRKVLFAEIIHNLVLEGGAAQANAAFAGALLGAYLGYDAVPENWRKGLNQRTFLMEKCKLTCLSVDVITGDKRKIKTRSSRISRVRPKTASERRAMESTIEDKRKTRLKMLQKRWGKRRTILRERRGTVYDSLKFPPKGK